MRKRVQITLAVLLVAIAGVIAWQVLRQREPEPVYQKKGLSVWLEQYGTNHFPTVRDGPLGKEAEAAIRQIGTNAIPVYLRILTAMDPPLKEYCAMDTQAVVEIVAALRGTVWA